MPSQPQLATREGSMGCHSQPIDTPLCPRSVFRMRPVFQSQNHSYRADRVRNLRRRKTRNAADQSAKWQRAYAKEERRTKGQKGSLTQKKKKEKKANENVIIAEQWETT